MGRDRYTVGDPVEGQKRLDHYNAWLMDPKRPIDGKPYPGYPGETKQKSTVLPVTVAQKLKKSHNTRMLNEKGNEMSKVTKLSQATELVRASASKSDALANIMNVLGVSKSNAFVYFTKATKALGQPPVVAGTVLPKAAKVSKAKVNPVTETSPEKARARVAEIDAVIANLRKSGATVASPFGGL